GWSYVQDTTISYNNSQGDPITGKVVNYIVQKYATNGSDFGPFWMSWTSDHSLIRKPNIMQGTVVNPNPFNVGMEWDTVPAKLDTTGYYSYKDIWDNLGSHEYFSNIGPTAVNDEVETGNTLLVAVHVLNNDLYYAPVTVSIDQPPTQGNAEVQPENPNVITYMANPDFIGLDSLSYKISYQANPAFYASAKVYINVTEDIGIEETILNSGMIVYPNPVVAEHFTVGSDKMIQAVQVFDLTGKEIYNKIFASPIREAEISLGNGYHGIYLVKANFTNKQSFSQKILIK
ncbi:MAG: T9SS type A sorting domain-containing protein, partial [Bacteroidales bacterium]|nr:T9SS type A sorting domain-containing protein [Bacteroidales bacterium]